MAITVIKRRVKPKHLTPFGDDTDAAFEEIIYRVQNPEVEKSIFAVSLEYPIDEVIKLSHSMPLNELFGLYGDEFVHGYMLGRDEGYRSLYETLS